MGFRIAKKIRGGYRNMRHHTLPGMPKTGAVCYGRPGQEFLHPRDIPVVDIDFAVLVKTSWTRDINGIRHGTELAETPTQDLHLGVNHVLAGAP